MQRDSNKAAKGISETRSRFSALAGHIRAEAPSLGDSGIAILSAILLIISFPDFNLWPLAWVSLVPILLAIARRPSPVRSFILGWLFGGVFFFGSCYWLTYSMIHFGGMPTPIAFVVLIPGALTVGIFPAFFALALAQVMRRLGPPILFLAPAFWAALEWARLGIAGQLWNAIGYSQAFHPNLIQPARWGGVYLVGFLILLVNTAIAFVALKRTLRSALASAAAILLVAIVLGAAHRIDPAIDAVATPDAVVVAVQPNVPMDLVKSVEDMKKLATRHFEMSESALRALPSDAVPRLLVWPESPMNFGYGGDAFLRERLAAFARTHHTSILINSQEVAPNDGIYNSALLINQAGSLVTQYDKIRLLPFGEYVPLPQWLPGAGLIRGIVGDFTPGTNYRLMPVGSNRAGVFICIESAYPSIARSFTGEGADVLINISNDGYLGPTAVMRQHLANAVFRAVENDRTVMRVTNTGITALITPTGAVQDATEGFKPEVRTWRLTRSQSNKTFYVAHGDLFAAACAVLSLLLFGLSFMRRRSREL
ncbi:MAG TPA: apolipoprotein N-acyltransferase [Pyrinomonadaceae bacterium]|nr:apolipoprotein N-acyltransferase [Pyrinomonadaceae bacterium]